MNLRYILGEVKEDSPQLLRVRKCKLGWAGNSSSATTWLIVTGQRDKEQIRICSRKRKEIRKGWRSLVKRQLESEPTFFVHGTATRCLFPSCHKH